MGPWQTGREGVWSLAEKVGSLGGGSGVVRKDQCLKRKGGEQMGEKKEKD